MRISKLIFALVATSAFGAQPCAAAHFIPGATSAVTPTLGARMPLGAPAKPKSDAGLQFMGTIGAALKMPPAQDRLLRKTTMLEVGQILGRLSALLLVTAFLAWLKLGWRPLVQQMRGRPGCHPTTGDTAPRLLMSGVGLSTVAAILSVTGCIFR